jgi:hypothetical protein
LAAFNSATSCRSRALSSISVSMRSDYRRAETQQVPRLRHYRDAKQKLPSCR